MNGKGLLLLSKDMFMHRVPVGGGILYEDIQLRLQKVVASQATDRTVPTTTQNGTWYVHLFNLPMFHLFLYTLIYNSLFLDLWTSVERTIIVLLTTEFLHYKL